MGEGRAMGGRWSTHTNQLLFRVRELGGRHGVPPAELREGVLKGLLRRLGRREEARASRHVDGEASLGEGVNVLGFSSSLRCQVLYGIVLLRNTMR